MDEQHLAALLKNGWARSTDGKRLEKSFKFADFVGAFAWMTAISGEAEAINHHPDWKNSYDRVDVSLTTHSKSVLTDLDIALAQVMDDQYSLANRE